LTNFNNFVLIEKGMNTVQNTLTQCSEICWWRHKCITWSHRKSWKFTL